MSEAEGFLALAEYVDALPANSPAFLCWYLDPMFGSEHPPLAIPSQTRQLMLRRIWSHNAMGSLMDASATWEERRLSRVLAAIFLAHLAFDDE